MIQTPNVTVHAGHVLEVLATMPSSSVDCVVTSPPYWGLRAYGTTPQVWGGSSECTHAFEDRAGSVIVGSQNVNGKSTLKTTGTKHDSQKIDTLTATCALCGAWRGEYGLEPSPELYVAHTVAIFREVRRVMRDHGTLWLNIGDSYSSGGRSTYDTKGGVTGLNTPRVPRTRNTGRNDTNRETPGGRGGSFRGGDRAEVPVLDTPGIKPKDMVGIPWMVAFALRADGWYLRSDVIWAKPNPMPESVIDRPTKAHEYLFLLSKSEGYYYDRVASREDAKTEKWPGIGPQHGTVRNRNEKYEPMTVRAKKPSGWSSQDGAHTQLNGPGRYDQPMYDAPMMAGRNARTVWTIATQPYPEAHFATFPEELPRRCISASCPMQICTTCMRPRERIVDDALPELPPDHTGIRGRDEFNVGSVQSRMNGGDYMEWREEHPIATLGWTDCGHDTYVPGVVLDPFAGSGTTLAVAAMLGVRGLGIELNSEYLAMIERRVAAAEIARSRGGSMDERLVAVPVADMGPLWEVREQEVSDG